MKEKIKKIIFGYLPGFITGLIVCGTISVIAATYFPSNDVTYDNSTSGLSSTDVQGAIDELYGVCTAKPPAGEQIIENAGLEKDQYECRYFFTGANPNNYITFNDENAGWRIISVECDGRIKIMKVASIGEMAWDSSINNNWSRPASLNTYLNGTYYNNKLNNKAQNQIISSDFSIGAINYGENNMSTQVSKENATKWHGNIALPTMSEYLRTNSNKSSCGTFSLNNANYTSCKNTTWMFNINYYWLTLSPYYGTSTHVFTMSNDGYVIYYTTDIANYSVRPTVYLSSEVKITGGDGSKSNPYTIE